MRLEFVSHPFSFFPSFLGLFCVMNVLKIPTYWKQECIPVGCLSSTCWPYPVVSGWRWCLPGGVCPVGDQPRECLPGGVSAPGGEYLPRGCMADTPLWTVRHLWKHNLRKLRLRSVKNLLLKGATGRHFSGHFHQSTKILSAKCLPCAKIWGGWGLG